MPRVTVRYFAVLREQAGIEVEQLETQSQTPADLYRELKERYSFSLPVKSLRVAIDGEFGSMGAHLEEGAEIAFIAPVAGG